MSFRCESKISDQFNKSGNVLIADQFNNRVIEVTPTGEIVWSFGLGPNDFSDQSIIGVNDAERVDDMTLMVGTGTPPGVILESKNGAVDNRVIMVSPEGNIVWEYGQFGLTGLSCNLLNVPVQATFIPCSKCKKNTMKCGSVLITDQGNNRVIRVNGDKEIIWQYPGANTSPFDQLNSPNSAQRLDDGHYLIADGDNKRALEVDRCNRVIKAFTASGTLGTCAFASRLPNGNTLLTDEGKNRIVEVDTNDTIVWQYITNAEAKSMAAPRPSRAVRLDDGDTLISDQYNNRVIRINGTAIIVDYYGLSLSGNIVPSTNFIGTNKGYNTKTTQLGLYAPYDAKIINDYTGLTAVNSK
jgi:hypothetical protein